MTLIDHCPKCGSSIAPPQVLESQCPVCEVWLHKVYVEPSAALAPEVEALFAEPPAPERNPTVLLGRAATLLFVAIWGIFLANMDYHEGEINASFMHAILLPIHEAGHVFFIPFGQFMTVLGGSLFQVALPLGIGTAFLYRQRDAFGAAICLWWAGASFVDLAPYIWDAIDPQLILLGGHTGEDGPHDWIYLLERLGTLSRAHAYGTFAHHLGVLMMLAAVVWGGRRLWQRWAERNKDALG